MEGRKLYNSLRTRVGLVSILKVDSNFTLTSESQKYAVQRNGFYCITIVSNNDTPHDLGIDINDGLTVASQYATSQFHRCTANIPLAQGTQIILRGHVGDMVNINRGA